MQALGVSSLSVLSLAGNQPLALCVAPALSHCAKSFGHIFCDAASYRWYYQQACDDGRSHAASVSSNEKRSVTTAEHQPPFSNATHSGTAQVSLWDRLSLSKSSTSSQSGTWQPVQHLDITKAMETSAAFPMVSATPVFARSWLSVSVAQDLIDDAALYAGKAKARVKGIGKKLVLRQVNKRIIARIARRATIGIPCLGFFLVSQVLWKDSHRIFQELKLGNKLAASAFACAVFFEASDLLAQAVIVSGLAGANFHIAGFTWLAAYLAMADKFSLASAGATCTAALVGELLALHDGKVEASPHEEEQQGGPAPPTA